ncbi:glycosyltransferase [Escherichia coli]|uniref:glycosyltransferase n=1 Tax=Escherichia coli TaxID=562 RepID=UPI003D89E0EF
MKKVIAIIVTFKRKHLLCKVIESILNQTVKPMEIIIIDNNSNDGTREVVKNFLIMVESIFLIITLVQIWEEQEDLKLVFRRHLKGNQNISGLWMMI